MVRPFVNARRDRLFQAPSRADRIGRLHLDQLGSPAGAVHDAHRAPRHRQSLRQQIDQGSIRRATNGRRLDLDFDGVTVTANDAVTCRTRLEMHLQSQADGSVHEVQ